MIFTKSPKKAGFKLPQPEVGFLNVKKSKFVPKPASPAAHCQTHSSAIHWVVNTAPSEPILLWMPSAPACRVRITLYSPLPSRSRLQALCQQHCFTTILLEKQNGSQNLCIYQLLFLLEIKGDLFRFILNHLQNLYCTGRISAACPSFTSDF